jgi:hypothetical protein
MSTEPSVVDLAVFRQLLLEQVQRHEITAAEAVRCWLIHAQPMIAWRAAQ